MANRTVPAGGESRAGPSRWRRQLRTFLGAWWRELTALGPHNNAHWGALQVAVAAVVPLVLVLAVGQSHLAGYAVFGSLSSVYGRRFGRPDRLHAQLGSGAALTVAVLVGVLAGVNGSPAVTVPATAFMSMVGLVLARRYGWLPVPSLFLVLATGTISSVRHTWGELPIALLLTALAAGWGVLVGQLGVFMQPGSSLIPAPEVRTKEEIIALPGFGPELVLYGLGPLVAGGTAAALGIGHPYWAAVTATVPMSGRDLPSRLARATLRLAGTTIGIGIAYLLLAREPEVWVLVAAVAAFQVLTELFVARNYGIAVVCITPMALILGQLVAPHPVDVLIIDRLVETVIGVVVSALAIVVMHVVRRPVRRADAARRSEGG